MTTEDLAELRTWAEALAPAGCRQAKLVLALLAEQAELSAVWDAAVRAYPQPVPMPEAVQNWWRGVYERIVGRTSA